MNTWLEQNWLALYGAIVGTFALFINFSKFIHGITKDKVKIYLSFEKHPEFEENIKRLRDSQSNEAWNRLNVVEVYFVTVRNVGIVPLHVDSIGVQSSKNKKHEALLSTGSNGTLIRTSNTNLDPIPPKSSKTFSVYLGAKDETFYAKKAYLLDGTGKKWKA